MKLNTILEGHVIDVLTTIPDNSIDCIVTSPPYWALRDYGLQPQIWGGEEKCEHDWHPHKVKCSRGKGSDNSWEQPSRSADPNWHDRTSSYCVLCGAWRGSLGLEPLIGEFIDHLVTVFDEVHRVLAIHGTCWVNISDTFYGSGSGHTKEAMGKHVVPPETYATMSSRPTKNQELPTKCLSLIPERFAIEMVHRGWILRNKIIWHKPNPLPESVGDRFSVDFENLYLFVKQKKYYFEQQFVQAKESTLTRYAKGDWPKVGGDKYTDNDYILHGERFSGKKIVATPVRNRRCVWTIPPQPVQETHFATFPESLIEIPIAAGCPKQVCTGCGTPRYPVIKVKALSSMHRDVQPKGLDSLTASAAFKEGGWNISSHTGLKTKQIVGYTKCECDLAFRKGCVLDPFIGSGTTAIVATKLGLDWLGIELNPDYIEIAYRRGVGQENLAHLTQYPEATPEQKGN